MAEDLNIAKNRKLEYELLIDTPEGLFDVADYLTDLEIERGDTSRIGTGQSGTDNTVATMNFTLHNDGRVGGAERVNFSPRDENSPMNNWDGEYNPLLFPNVEVIFQLKIQNFKTELMEYIENFYFYNGEHEVDAESEIDGEEEVDAESDGIEWLNELFGQNAETGSKYAFEDEPIEDAVDVFKKGKPLNPDDYEINYEDKIVNIWLNSSLGQNDISAFYYFGNDDWITMFQGFLGDDIRVSAHEVTCEMRDLAKPMQDKLVEELQEYGDTDNPPTAEEVIREIMEENGFEDYPFDPNEDSDGSEFSITEYQVEYVSVWQAIQEIAAERGWFLGFRWDADDGNYRLKFLEPNRGMDADSADYEIDWSTDFYDDEFNLSDKDIRNACKVVYRNRDSGEIENVTYEDQESIDTYGRKFMQFEEEDTSLIDTEEEANQLAEAAVKDLRELPAGQDVTLPICPELDVLMGVNINDPRLSSTKDFVGIESVRHSFTFGKDPSYETYIVGSGYVSGGHKKWIDRDARRGVKKPIPGSAVTRESIINDRYSDESITTPKISEQPNPIRITFDEDTNQGSPDLVQLENKDILIAYQEGTGDTRSIFVTHFDDPDWKKTVTDTSNDERNPTIIQLENGDLLCAYQTDEESPQAIVGKFSYDKGENWEDRVIIAQEDNEDASGNLGLIQTQNGDILCAYDTTEGFSDATGIKVVRSTDNGSSWGSPTTVYDGGASAHLVEIKEDYLLCVFQTREDSDTDNIKLIKSFDNGDTWKEKEDVAVDNDRIYRYPSLVLLPNGLLLCSYFYDPEPGEPNASVLVKRSIDTGYSWGDNYFVHGGGAAPSSNAKLNLLNNNRVTCVFHTLKYDEDYYDCALLYSWDNGASWRGQSND